MWLQSWTTWFTWSKRRNQCVKLKTLHPNVKVFFFSSASCNRIRFFLSVSFLCVCRVFLLRLLLIHQSGFCFVPKPSFDTLKPPACKIFSPAAADLAVPRWLQAEGRSLHSPQRSGQQLLSDQTGHQWKCHGRHGGQDAGQSPADQHQTQVSKRTRSSCTSLIAKFASSADDFYWFLLENSGVCPDLRKEKKSSSLWIKWLTTDIQVESSKSSCWCELTTSNILPKIIQHEQPIPLQVNDDLNSGDLFSFLKRGRGANFVLSEWFVCLLRFFFFISLVCVCVCVCRTVVWDRNNISPQGLQDIAAALEK